MANDIKRVKRGSLMAKLLSRDRRTRGRNILVFYLFTKQFLMIFCWINHESGQFNKSFSETQFSEMLESWLRQTKDSKFGMKLSFLLVLWGEKCAEIV